MSDDSMPAPGWLRVVERPFPSSTLVLIAGPRPIVVDPGSATDADDLLERLEAANVRVEDATVVCTHYHADHVGAVGTLQGRGARVTAHAWDAAMINGRDAQACASRWLDQPVLPFRADVPVADGDTIGTGTVELQVLHTPGHTLGAISLWHPDSRTLVCGDALHEADVPWIGASHEGAGSLARAALTLDRIEDLRPALVVSGHGPPITDVTGAVARTRERLASWADDPRACAMHAARRILVYRLMLEPLNADDARGYVLAAPWLRDLAAAAETAPDAFADELLASLDRVLERRAGLLRTTAPHRTGTRPPWHHIDPRSWPR